MSSCSVLSKSEMCLPKNSGLALKNKVLKIDRVHGPKSISNLVSRPILHGIGVQPRELGIIGIETESI